MPVNSSHAGECKARMPKEKAKARKAAEKATKTPTTAQDTTTPPATADDKEKDFLRLLKKEERIKAKAGGGGRAGLQASDFSGPVAQSTFYK